MVVRFWDSVRVQRGNATCTCTARLQKFCLRNVDSLSDVGNVRVRRHYQWWTSPLLDSVSTTENPRFLKNDLMALTFRQLVLFNECHVAKVRPFSAPLMLRLSAVFGIDDPHQLLTIEVNTNALVKDLAWVHVDVMNNVCKRTAMRIWFYFNLRSNLDKMRFACYVCWTDFIHIWKVRDGDRSYKRQVIAYCNILAPECGVVPGRIGLGPRSGIFLTYSAGPVVILLSWCHRRTWHRRTYRQEL